MWLILYRRHQLASVDEDIHDSLVKTPTKTPRIVSRSVVGATPRVGEPGRGDTHR